MDIPPVFNDLDVPPYAEDNIVDVNESQLIWVDLAQVEGVFVEGLHIFVSGCGSLDQPGAP